MQCARQKSDINVTLYYAFRTDLVQDHSHIDQITNKSSPNKPSLTDLCLVHVLEFDSPEFFHHRVDENHGTWVHILKMQDFLKGEFALGMTLCLHTRFSVCQGHVLYALNNLTSHQ